MKRATLALAVLLAASPVLAQQGPSQLAIQMQRVIGDWALQIEQLQRQIEEQQKRLEAVTKERDDLKAKAAPEK